MLDVVNYKMNPSIVINRYTYVCTIVDFTLNENKIYNMFYFQKIIRKSLVTFLVNPAESICHVSYHAIF